MAQRSWKEAIAEELPKLQSGFAEATDDIRHKVIEQAWSGQEQTGSNYMAGIYDTLDKEDTGQEQTAQGDASGVTMPLNTIAPEDVEVEELEQGDDEQEL